MIRFITPYSIINHQLQVNKKTCVGEQVINGAEAYSEQIYQVTTMLHYLIDTYKEVINLYNHGL